MSSAAPSGSAAASGPGGKLGLIAGGGDLPVRLIDAARDAGRDLYVLAIQGQADIAAEALAGIPHDWVRIGSIGKALDLLRAAGVRDLIFAGRIKRPSFVALMPDARGAKFLAKVAGKALGDDGLLRAVITEFESEGFRVLGPDDVLVDLLVPAGALGRIAPDETAWADIRHGMAIARGIGALDVGQAAVVQQGLVLGVEAIEGTDALLARCADLRRDGPGGVLVKAKKPSQERRIDLPTIGPRTVEGAAKAGLRGIAVEAGQALLLDRDGLIAAADRLGLFVVGVPADSTSTTGVPAGLGPAAP
ncbi:MAG TPA: UDP-2,3-diacylglucosamine diphosphatase LpxI [Alphaproteobacteria bacterium]